jgi:Amt family ammonium transporter
VTVGLIYICRAVTSLRVEDETETTGLDLAVHGERAYDLNS